MSKSTSQKLEYMRKFYLKNKIKLLEYQSEYTVKNKDRINEYQKVYRINHPNRSKKYLDNNPHKYKYYHNRRIKFKGKSLIIDKQLRVGVCSFCKKSVKNGDIKRTNLHHIKYDIEHPEENTIELCVGCHRKEHKKIRDGVKNS